MYKKRISLAVSFLPLLAATTLQAAPPTATLEVNGKVITPSCDITVDNNGVYEVGNITPSMLSPTTETTLPTMVKNWQVTCKSLIYLSVIAIDNRVDSSTYPADRGKFGLGFVNGEGKIGFYRTLFTNLTVDSKPAHYLEGGTVYTGDSRWITKDTRMVWAHEDKSLFHGKTFTSDVEVRPVLASTATMKGPVTQESNIDGSITLDFAFGI